MDSKRNTGITLIEVLIALAVFGLVLAAAYGAVTASLRLQAEQEAVTSSQARLRRVIEVVSQDVRSAVFGSLASQPYDTSEDSLSFLLLSGAAGYTVDPQEPFSTAYAAEIVAESANHLLGARVLLANGNGQSVTFPVTRVSNVGDRQFRLEHASCPNTITADGGVQLFEVTSLGFRFDEASRTIFQNAVGGSEFPLAFNIDRMDLEYIYETTSTGAAVPMIKRSVPFQNADGAPLRVYFDGSANMYVLSRIGIELESRETVRGRVLSRTVTGFVDLSTNQHFMIREVAQCGA